MKIHLLLTLFLATTAAIEPQNTPPAAEQVFAAALQRAAAEDKLVLFEFGASWCAPCRRLEAFLSAPETSAILRRYYVVSRITVWENGPKESLNNAGGSELMYSLGGGDGVPFFGIAEPSGAILETSRKAKIDYPAKRGQVAAFMGLIERTARGMSATERKTLADFLLERADAESSIAGRVVNAADAPVSDAHVVIARPTYRYGRWQNSVEKRLKTDAGGQYLFESLVAGDYVITAEHPAAAAAAESILVKPGEDLTRDIVLARPHGSLTGRVIDSAARSVTAGVVSLMNLRWTQSGIETQLGHGGVFEFTKLVPGDYMLSVRLPSSDGRLGAQHEITILEGQRGTLEVVAHNGATVSGTILLPPDIGKASIAGLEVLAISGTPPVGSASQTASAPASVSHGFALRGLFGTRFIRVRGLPEGWYLEAVLHAGRDTTDAPLDVTSGKSIDGLEVVLSDAGAKITGRVEAPDGTPRAEGAVVVFPRDPRRRTFPSRSVRRAAVDDAGTFVVTGLPPGEYLVAAVRSLSSAWDAPETLIALADAAASVRVERRGQGFVTIAPPK